MEGETESDWVKLPTLDKCQHKAWKARIMGYEEAAKLFNRTDEPKDPEFSKYLGVAKKFVTDSNAFAQDKGLDAMLAYVQNAGVAGRTCGEVVSGVIAKCLNSAKQKTKDKGIDVILMYIEIDKQEAVQEELLKGLDNKQPKIVVGCLVTFTTALREFGSKVISIKPLIKVIPKLLEDRDKIVREETKHLIIEIYRWIGVAIKPQMSHFQPIQISELDAEFEKLPPKKAIQSRFMRSQQDLKVKMEAQQEVEAAAQDTVGGESVDAAQPVEEVIDPYDFADPVNILNNLPKNFFARIEEKKWQERKEVLSELQALCEKVRLEPGEYGDLVRSLKHIVVKDSNIMLVVIAVKCLSGLAKGLRRSFQSYANQCICGVIEKFKEKKPHVVAALRDAIDALFSSTTFDPNLEDFVIFLTHKNPSIKAEMMLFLGRCFRRSTPAILNKKLLKTLYPPIVKNMSDMSPEVRETAYEALGMAMRVAGEKSQHSFLVDLDTLKLAKIKEYHDKSSDDPAAKKPETARPATAPPTTTATTTEAKKVKGGGGAAKATKTKVTSKKPKKEEVIEAVLTDEVVEEKSREAMGEETMKMISNNDWKERLGGCEAFTKTLCTMDQASIPTQALVRVLIAKPGLKDNNFQVLKLRIELIAHLAKHGNFTKTSASFVLCDLVSKISDAKNGSHAQEALSCIAEATSLEFISEEVLQLAFAQKNPKTHSEALNWLARSIKDFGFKVMAKSVIDYTKKSFLATNPAVRTSALSLLGVMYMHMGATLRMFFEGEKAALLQQIDAEFEKVKDDKLPTPTRRSKTKDGEVKDEGDTEDGTPAEPEVVNPEDLIARTDVSNKITDELLNKLGDKNWKIRMEGLENVMEIIKEAKFVKTNIGSLPEALKPRLSDSNKLMVSYTINLCNSIVTAMGPAFKNHIRVLGVGIITCFGNSMPKIRTETASLLDTIVEKCGLVPFVEAEILIDVLKLENPVLKAELLGWLATQLPNHKQLPTEFRACTPPILACLEDRNADVRKRGQEVLVPVMLHTGYESFVKAANKLKVSSKDQLMPILEKARGNLPAKPEKVAKAAPKVAKVEDKAEPSPNTSKPAKAAVKKGAPPPKRKQTEEDTSPPISISYTKEQRVKDEKAMKVLKWAFTEPRGEFVDQLKQQMEKNFSKAMMEYMFKDDFKVHIKAIDILCKIVEENSVETIGNLDLILKWFSLRFYDTNPSMLNRALDYLCALFPVLADNDYHLSELDAQSFLPHLIDKVGSSKENVRKGVRTIFNLMCKVYPASKLFVFIVDGLRSKNSKQRTECLEELGCMMEVFGVSVCQPTPAQCVKLISQHISDRDNSVRSAALNTLVTMFNIMGENLFKHTNNLNAKELALLEERIKRSQKTRGPNIVVPEQQQALKRPATAPPSNKLQANHCPARPQTSSGRSNYEKVFTLEMIGDTGPDRDKDLIPNLEDYDMVDITETITLPKTKVKATNNENEVSSEIAIVISRISHKDPDICTAAIAQIDSILLDPDRCLLLSEHSDQLLLMVNMQLKLCQTAHMSNENLPKQTVTKLYRCLIALILSLFKEAKLAYHVASDILQDLISNVVLIMVDLRMDSIPEGGGVIRSLNVLVIKIIEFTDPTNILSALIKLLHNCLATDSVTKSKFINLVLKCLWKDIKSLEKKVDDIKISRILHDCHLFFVSFPSTSWHKDGHDMPLRTIKTIIFTICKQKREKVLDHMGEINHPDSEIYKYIHKLLANEGIDVTAYNPASFTTNNNATNISNNAPLAKQSSQPKRRLSQVTHAMLTEIFRKIGQKENTKEGLDELYDFKLQHPDEDMTPYTNKVSQFFRNYMEQGLKRVELERKSGQHDNRGSSGGNSAPDVTKHDPSSTSITAPMVDKSAPEEVVFQTKLLALRSLCGLNRDGTAVVSEDKPVVTPEPAVTVATVDSTSPQPHTDTSEELMVKRDVIPVAMETSPVNVSDIRKRLDKIKQFSNINN